MEAVINLILVGVIIAVGVIITVANTKSDWTGCEDEGGPNCRTCPFPCKHNRTEKK